MVIDIWTWWGLRDFLGKSCWDVTARVVVAVSRFGLDGVRK